MSASQTSKEQTEAAIFESLVKAWDLNPELTFGQLICTVASTSNGRSILFNISNENLLDNIKCMINLKKKPDAS